MMRWIVVWIWGIMGLYAQADAILGVWETEDKRAHILIYKAKNQYYYGKIVWMKEPYDSQGRPKRDVHNPNPALRSRLLMNMPILLHFCYNAKEKRWENGKIYNPEDGNTYQGSIMLESPNVLLLRGYLGFSWLGKTTRWRRVR